MCAQKRLSRKQLEVEQARNLKFLEMWSETFFPSVQDVPLVKALTYELIQVLNNASVEGMKE